MLYSFNNLGKVIDGYHFDTRFLRFWKSGKCLWTKMNNVYSMEVGKQVFKRHPIITIKHRNWKRKY